MKEFFCNFIKKNWQLAELNINIVAKVAHDAFYAFRGGDVGRGMTPLCTECVCVFGLCNCVCVRWHTTCGVDDGEVVLCVVVVGERERKRQLLGGEESLEREVTVHHICCCR